MTATEVLPDALDLIFVIGGDGTLIRAARDTAAINVPLIGVNLGTLGYLCELEEATVFAAIDQIMEDKFMLEARMRLSGYVVQSGTQEREQTALNDIVIHRSGALQLVSLVVYVNGQYLRYSTPIMRMELLSRHRPDPPDTICRQAVRSWIRRRG